MACRLGQAPGDGGKRPFAVRSRATTTCQRASDSVSTARPLDAASIVGSRGIVQLTSARCWQRSSLAWHNMPSVKSCGGSVSPTSDVDQYGAPSLWAKCHLLSSPITA